MEDFSKENAGRAFLGNAGRCTAFSLKNLTLLPSYDSFPDLPKSRPQLPAWAFSLSAIFILAVLFIPLYIWFFCRVEPMADEIVVLIRKTEKNPAQGAVLAAKDEKGIQLDVLAEGRHFLNPYIY